MIIWLVKTKTGEMKSRLMRNIFNVNDVKYCGKCVIYSWMLNEFLKWSCIQWHDILIRVYVCGVRAHRSWKWKMQPQVNGFSTKNSTVDLLLLCAACCWPLAAGCCRPWTACTAAAVYRGQSSRSYTVSLSVFLSSNLVSNLKWPYLPADNYIISTYIGNEILTDCNQKLHKLPSVALNCFRRFLFST